ncbi:MAG: alpha-glucosidase/alpha-galactosidase [Anaerolineae bacterium]|nr:alpha-glucosidase/alpha-galactosidase [Anaerolineae bacterium]
MTKITFIGAGSTVFARNLMGDILQYPALQDVTLSLHDIDEERLSTSGIVARKVAETLGVAATIETTTDRRAALDGADYVISMFQIAGYKPGTVIDFEVPKRYGLRQTIGDTLGIGGIMRALRTIPVFLDMARDMQQLCPDVMHLNYVNPMAMNCLALNRGSAVRTVGLCHSVQGTAAQLAHDIGVPLEEINYLAAGINHMAFYLKFKRDGEDLYPLIHQAQRDGRAPEHNRVRYEMLGRLGYFVTESSEHFSEYVPWFIKRDRGDLIEEFNVPLDEYLRRCEQQIDHWQKLRAELEAPDYRPENRRSTEYGSQIINAYGNVSNDGLIDYLPQGCAVEVPCLVDCNGVQPTRIGALPPQLAALIRSNVNVQELTVEAALTGKREHIYHAAMLDPHTAAELSLEQIYALVDDLIEAHGDSLPEYH